MAEGIRYIAYAQRFAERGGAAQPDLQVANQGLATDEEFIGLEIPGANRDAPGSGIALQALFLLRVYFEEIVQDDRLPVQHKVGKIWIVVKDIEQGIDDMHQSHAKLLEGLVPFTIPMRMWNQDDVELLGHIPSLLAGIQYAR